MTDLGSHTVALRNRVRLFCTSLGPVDAAAILLVHGWGGDGREWSAHAETLAKAGFRVIVPDLRGHGHSEVPEKGNTPAEMADDLAELIETLDAGPVIAVGHSMGGQVVNLLAGRHQQAVHSIVTLDPAHGADEAEAEAIPARLAACRTHGARAAAALIADSFAPTSPVGLATAHIRTMLGTPDHVIVQAYAGMYTDADAVGIRKQSEEYLRHRICPSLTVWTSNEPAAWENEVLHIPGSRVDHWPDTGHYMHEERPRRTIKLIEKWADSTLED